MPIVDSEMSNFIKIETTFPTATRIIFHRPSRATQPQTNHASPSFARSRSLDMALAEVPEVRASEVARGKALVADPNYPSVAQIQKIAGVLTAHWNRPVARPGTVSAGLKLRA